MSLFRLVAKLVGGLLYRITRRWSAPFEMSADPVSRTAIESLSSEAWSRDAEISVQEIDTASAGKESGIDGKEHTTQDVELPPAIVSSIIEGDAEEVQTTSNSEEAGSAIAANPSTLNDKLFEMSASPITSSPEGGVTQQVCDSIPSEAPAETDVTYLQQARKKLKPVSRKALLALDPDPDSAGYLRRARQNLKSDFRHHRRGQPPSPSRNNNHETLRGPNLDVNASHLLPSGETNVASSTPKESPHRGRRWQIWKGWQQVGCLWRTKSRRRSDPHPHVRSMPHTAFENTNTRAPPTLRLAQTTTKIVKTDDAQFIIKPPHHQSPNHPQILFSAICIRTFPITKLTAMVRVLRDMNPDDTPEVAFHAYEVGEVFEVVGVEGDSWHAYRRGDPDREVGGLMAWYFRKLRVEIEQEQSDGRFPDTATAGTRLQMLRKAKRVLEEIRSPNMPK